MAQPNNKKKVSSHIPDDLAISILSKLPLNSLKRFTSARKSWTLLFQNPHFIQMFSKNFISAHSSLYDDTCILLKQTVSIPSDFDFVLHCLLYLIDGENFENKVKLELPARFHEEYNHGWPLDLSGCINGIICLFDVNNERGIFWNPATNECINIPPSPCQLLASNSTIFTVHGFGHDHVRDDYKVIRCVRFERTPRVVVEAGLEYAPTGPGPLWEIYSVRSNSWRKLDVNVPHKLGCSDVYLNGMCHWFGGTSWLGGPLEQFPVVNCVVSFNLSTEMFLTTPLLFDMHDGDNSELQMRPKRELVVLNGSIAMISSYSVTPSFHISILGEPGFEGSWVKLFIVGPLSFIRGPIGAGKNSELFFRTKDGELVCFDLNTQKFEEVGLKGVVSCQTSIYKKNLFPIIRV